VPPAPAPNQPVGAASTPPARTAGLAPAPEPPAGQEGSNALRTLAFVGGGALLATGIVTGLVAIKKKGTLDGQCEDKHCTAAAQDDYDSGRMFGNVATVTTIAGAALLGIGFLLPSGGPTERSGSTSAKGPHIWMSAGPFSAAVAGRFDF
jgi:hypothetical protein